MAKVEKIDAFRYSTMWNVVLGSEWVCINGVNAGRIAKICQNPLTELVWNDTDTEVEYSGRDLFVYKR